ncbi:hypothetical protein AB2N04_00270 (plasmid) [Nitratireductor sp. GISD-1A_MAKvit]|uniref:anti-sigma factor family protein n=1 Tax=Nitratireductor sp. GISD-1A_MAKvit TaxID=3234198 RepID=UPI00346543BC
MNRLSEEDLINLNAFHDGEMVEGRRAFARRLEAEPELRSALAEIRQISASLKALHPGKSRIPPAKNDNRQRRWWIASALAGSIALAYFSGAYFFGMSADRPEPGGPRTAFAIHQNFAEQVFVSRNEVFNTVAGRRIAEFPDLSAANLTLVALRDMPRGSAAHFAGREGCRLTVFSSETPVSPTDDQAGMQRADWSINARFYTIIATSMDEGKFAAIATYLEQATRRLAEPKTVVALRQATARATSCG